MTAERPSTGKAGSPGASSSERKRDTACQFILKHTFKRLYQDTAQFPVFLSAFMQSAFTRRYHRPNMLEDASFEFLTVDPKLWFREWLRYTGIRCQHG